MNEQKQTNEPASTEQALTALGIYESNWQHRDQFTVKEMYTLFYAAVVCNVIPFIMPEATIQFRPGFLLLFPMVASLLTVFFWVYMKACAVRMTAASLTVKKMMDCLPDELRRVEIKNITQLSQFWWARNPMSLWAPAGMCAGLSVLDMGVLLVLLFHVVKDIAVRQAICVSLFVGLLVVIWVIYIVLSVRKYNRIVEEIYQNMSDLF